MYDYRSLVFWFLNYFQNQCDCLGEGNSPQPSVALRSAPGKEIVLEEGPQSCLQGPHVCASHTSLMKVAITFILSLPRC